LPLDCIDMINRLLITNLRVLEQVELTTMASCNLFVGKNGSGKTSLLEGIFLLSRGKSFRHHQPRHYVRHQQTHCTAFAEFASGITVGVSKATNGEVKLRLNSANIATQSELTRELPVILLDPGQLDVLDHGSSERRALLDWLVFHIQPAFYKTWLGYQRILKQRNRLLREHVPTASLEVWDVQLARFGKQIHTMRDTVMQQWQPIFRAVCAEFLPHYPDITMRYSAGFDKAQGLLSVLQARHTKDSDLGYTRVGVHRADVLVHTDMMGDKKNAADVLSRGEKKLLITALKLSQLQLLSDVSTQAVVLLDDINAELDSTAISRLLAGLQHCGSQLFVTSLDEKMTDTLSSLWKDDIACFHLNHGHLSVFSA